MPVGPRLRPGVCKFADGADGLGGVDSWSDSEADDTLLLMKEARDSQPEATEADGQPLDNPDYTHGYEQLVV